ncbi:MAG: hypothetical protein CMH81_07055 [Nitrospiraceae bacterium]|nr:hypothetical protein [Nitrospiraceae bacterium]
MEKLTIVTGARADFHSEINPTFSPRLALLYALQENQTIRAAGSVAYRSPTLTHSSAHQISVNTIPTGAPPPHHIFEREVPITGSLNLKPEKIISYEADYQGWFWNHRLRFRSDLFYNQITNQIVTRDSANIIGITSSLETQNDLGSTNIYGGETGIEVLLAPWLTGYTNYTYQESSVTTDGPSAQRGIPRSKFNAGLRGDWESGLSGEINLHHIGVAQYGSITRFSEFASLGLIPSDAVPNSRVDGYTLLNLRGGYMYDDGTEVAFSIFNALNDKHREHPLGELLSTRIMLWLTRHF